MEEPVTAQADVPENNITTSQDATGKAGYYLYKK